MTHQRFQTEIKNTFNPDFTQYIFILDLILDKYQNTVYAKKSKKDLMQYIYFIFCILRNTYSFMNGHAHKTIYAQ